MDRAFVGTELKFQVDISACGFDMGTDRFDIILTCGAKTKKLTQDDLVYNETEDKYYMVVDTSEFCSGTLCAKVIAYVPDDDCDDHYRAEVDKAVLINLKL